ncbi:conserved hypothetical protein [Pseudarthrobacter chlorophenolicus A6]|uniref:DUF6919 domain-containing protein n=1 Tax=Pseudarthrobacter chlorophenolicus (strain ATCC 700700 / DSM 12829 / CIP 107037 / JCM 12360 / KCTC 9906 / NCIMB 13794 / A6) TaxID=452863 RepID=B8H873_PSECP|nr:hypothetical protein [Pseudarthrobacter chlorophenolicus]ACL38047.1 conserved hypothetical protein [Pseudarthrobacter chlorophenolicus A6]SDQ56070.1 hypothetical protein SAMN04489738_1489 [Pseudarthrobacter chlorophenolicus]
MKPEEIPARDQYGRLLEDRGVWRQATTLEGAGELTARWLEGGSSYQPGHFAPGYDDETNPIAATLAELNRNGLFTRESQPGILGGAGAQRQYVTGFCSGAAAGELLALSTRTELVTIAHAPGEASSAAIPVTLDGTEVVTVLGSSENPVNEEQIKAWADETNDSLALLLADSWYVEILDPVWGRNDVLLPAVLGALTGQD